MHGWFYIVSIVYIIYHNSKQNVRYGVVGEGQKAIYKSLFLRYNDGGTCDICIAVPLLLKKNQMNFVQKGPNIKTIENYAEEICKRPPIDSKIKSDFPAVHMNLNYIYSYLLETKIYCYLNRP